MGLMDDIKASAESNGTKVQSTEDAKLEKILNRMFYLDKNIDEEVKFVKQVMTRGLETQERVGLHASAMIVSDAKFCVRQQVLSLIYKMDQGEQVSVGLKRIFEEGNAIHEKWQRLFIRAGYGKARDMDRSRMNDEFEVSYTPDIECEIPEFYKGRMVGEIKSVNTFQFKKMTHHPSGKKQLHFYMYLTGIHKGFVLCEDKNTQDFKVNVEDYDEKIVEPFIERLEEVKYYKSRVFKNKKMVQRMKGCNSPSCKTAQSCPMRDACYGVGKGKVRIGGK